MKVEQFELTDPQGYRNIFAHFDTGAVYFRVTNVTEVGVWTYRYIIIMIIMIRNIRIIHRIRLYDTVEFPEAGVGLDVTAGVSTRQEYVAVKEKIEKDVLYKNIDNNFKICQFYQLS